MESEKPIRTEGEIEVFQVIGQQFDPQLVEQNRVEYNSFDGLYEQSGFCEETGGYWVSHIGHHFDGIRGNYEREVARLLYQNGNRVVLENEIRGWGKKSPDGTLNDVDFEICSIEETGNNTIKNHLNKVTSKRVQLVVIYYPSPEIFSIERLREGYNKYLKTPRSPGLNIYYIINGGIKVYKHK